jgi:hypothetical protein
MPLLSYGFLNDPSVIFNKVDIDVLCKKLSLHKGTIKRWVQQNKIPHNYKNDILSLLEEKIIKDDYRSLDEFYTKQSTANYCFDVLKAVLKKIDIKIEDYSFIEPSVGDGSFFNIMPMNRRVGIDINPNIKGLNIITNNYLDFLPTNNAKYIVMGNPPFGLRGNLALRFINHSNYFADIVAFILPPLFNSDGKGVPKKRVEGYKLIHSENLPLNSFAYPNGKDVNVATIFQIWSKVGLDKIEIVEEKTCKKFIKVYSLSDGGTPSSTRNKKMINNCDVYLPSTCFSGMMAYDSFEKLPNKRGYGIKILKNKDDIRNLCFNIINWKEEAFLSTNSAINLRTSLIEKALIKRGFFD